MSDFIKIQDQRIRKNTVKKYKPCESEKLNVYYNTSRYKIELETFKFKDKQERDSVINNLDLVYGLAE